MTAVARAYFDRYELLMQRVQKVLADLAWPGGTSVARPARHARHPACSPLRSPGDGIPPDPGEPTRDAHDARRLPTRHVDVPPMRAACAPSRRPVPLRAGPAR